MRALILVLLAACSPALTACSPASAGSMSVLGGGGGGADGGRTLVCDESVGSGGVADIDCTSIPAGDGDNLYIHFALRSEVAAATDVIWPEFNDDTTAANYEVPYQRGGSATSDGLNASARDLLVVPAASASAGYFSVGTCVVPLYSSTTFEKHMVCTYGQQAGLTWQNTLIWESTAAITDLRFVVDGGEDIAEGSRITIYRGP